MMDEWGFHLDGVNASGCGPLASLPFVISACTEVRGDTLLLPLVFHLQPSTHASLRCLMFEADEASLNLGVAPLVSASGVSGVCSIQSAGTVEHFLQNSTVVKEFSLGTPATTRALIPLLQECCSVRLQYRLERNGRYFQIEDLLVDRDAASSLLKQTRQLQHQHQQPQQMHVMGGFRLTKTHFEPISGTGDASGENQDKALRIRANFSLSLEGQHARRAHYCPLDHLCKQALCHFQKHGQIDLVEFSWRKYADLEGSDHTCLICKVLPDLRAVHIIALSAEPLEADDSGSTNLQSSHRFWRAYGERTGMWLDQVSPFCTCVNLEDGSREVVPAGALWSAEGIRAVRRKELLPIKSTLAFVQEVVVLESMPGSLKFSGCSSRLCQQPSALSLAPPPMRSALESLREGDRDCEVQASQHPGSALPPPHEPPPRKKVLPLVPPQKRKARNGKAKARLPSCKWPGDAYSSWLGLSSVLTAAGAAFLDAAFRHFDSDRDQGLSRAELNAFNIATGSGELDDDSFEFLVTNFSTHAGSGGLSQYGFTEYFVYALQEDFDDCLSDLIKLQQVMGVR